MKTKEKIKKYPFAKKLASEYNKRDSRKHYNIDKELSPGVLWSYRILTVVIFIATILYAVFKSSLAYKRLFMSVWDLATSFVYYILMVAPDVPFEPSVIQIPDIDVSIFLPPAFEAFRENFAAFIDTVFSLEAFLSFLVDALIWLTDLSRILMIALPLVAALKMIIDMIFDKANGKWFEKTGPALFYEKCYVGLVFPVREYIKLFFAYQKGHYFFTVLKIMWLCNFNIATVLIEAIAFYFYFCRSFDFINLYVQAYKLILDVLVFFKTTTLLLQAIIIYRYIDTNRKRLGFHVLRAHETSNQKIIEKMPLAIMITATMGAGKTTLLTDICLSLSLMYRNQALKRMHKYFKYFPNFPWHKFRKYIDLQIKRHKVYNLATCEKYVDDMTVDFLARPCPEKIYGYDINHYKIIHNNGLKNVFIWEALKIYAKLYFIYVMENSLICANYAIREDYIIENAGNMITFDGDFFSHPIDEECTHFSNILNYDLLRLGKTLVKNAAYRNSFEFGIVAMTEGGKERGNAIENLTIKKTDEECNVKNDLMNTRVMMSRHPAVVDNFPFIKFLLDEQRMMTLGASFRELCDIVEISESSSEKLACPLYHFEYILYSVLDSFLFKLNRKYDFTHGDISFLIRVLRDVTVAILNPLERCIDTYKYHVLELKIGRATSEERKTHKYYISDFKVYRDRFSTNTHNCYFRKRALESPIGFPDYPQYTSIEMDDEELHRQASLWVADMDDLSKEVLEDEEQSSEPINHKKEKSKPGCDASEELIKTAAASIESSEEVHPDMSFLFSRKNNS